MIVVIVAK